MIDAAALKYIVDTVQVLSGLSNREFVQTDVPVVLSAITSYCNRTLYKQTGLVDKFRAVPVMRDYLFVREFPLIQVSEVIENSVTLVAGTDYEIDNLAAGRIRRLNGQSTQLWRGQCVIQITYDAGYDPFPGDLLFVLSEVVARDYRRVKQREEQDDTMPDVTKLTLNDIGQVELANVSGWQPDGKNMHQLFGNYVTMLDPYVLPTSAGRDSFAASWVA